MAVYLETERLILRDWHADDFEHFARINSDPIVMEYYPARLDEAATRSLIKHFSNHIKAHGFGFYAVEHKTTKQFMGFAGLSTVPSYFPFAPAVEMAWRFDYEFWAKGYATEAAQALMEQAFKTLKLKEIVAYCVQDHQRAPDVLKNLGFVYDKKADFEYTHKRSKGDALPYVLFRLSAP